MGTEAGIAPSVASRREPASGGLLSALRASRIRAELLPALGAAALATAIGAWVLQLWKAPMDVPIVSNAGDELFNLLVIKDVLQHGWDLTNPSLAAPYGQELFDFPAYNGDNFFMAIVKGLGVISSNPAIVINIFYLLGFPLIAVSAYGVLRRLRISVGVAVVCAVLYAVLPFRFQSSEQHVFLSSYFTVPISCYLILEVLSGSELFARSRSRGGLRAYLTWRSAAVVAVLLVLGCSDSYFALFTVALTVPAAILSFLATRSPRPLICGLLAACLIFGAVVLNELPTIIYNSQHGVDSRPDERFPTESEVFSLSLASLVMPVEDNRIPVLAKLTHQYDSTVIIPESSEGSEPTFTSLGLAGTFGFAWLLASLGVFCVGRERAGPRDLRGVHAAAVTLMAFMIGTVGGLATLFAYIVTPRFHAPARICLFIAFFALLGAALALDRLRPRLSARPLHRAAFVAFLAIVVVTSVFYQTAPNMVPHYASQTKVYTQQAAFTHAIEAQVPGAASIFQIPYVPFPQGIDPGKINGYEDLYGFIFSDRLHWSGGAMEGRPTDWVPQLIKRPLPQILEGVSALGFAGIYLDTAGLPSRGALLEPQLSQMLGVSPIRGVEGRLAFFDMAAYNRSFRETHTGAQIHSIAESALGRQR